MASAIYYPGTTHVAELWFSDYIRTRTRGKYYFLNFSFHFNVPDFQLHSARPRINSDFHLSWIIVRIWVFLIKHDHQHHHPRYHLKPHHRGHRTRTETNQKLEYQLTLNHNEQLAADSLVSDPDRNPEILNTLYDHRNGQPYCCVTSSRYLA